MASVLTEILGAVLAPLPEDNRAQILAWVEHETQTRPIVAFVEDEMGVCWTLGEPSPMSKDGSQIVFAMLHHETQRQIVVYTFQPVVVDGKDGVQFYREIVWKPLHTQGPIGYDALYSDLRDWMLDEREVAADVCQRVAAEDGMADDDAAALRLASELLRADDEEPETPEPRANGAAHA